MMALASIDPSLAIGFYCRTLGVFPLGIQQLVVNTKCIRC